MTQKSFSKVRHRGQNLGTGHKPVDEIDPSSKMFKPGLVITLLALSIVHSFVRVNFVINVKSLDINNHDSREKSIF